MNLMIWNVLSNNCMKICHRKIVLWNVQHYFTQCVDIFMHQYILNDDGILGKVKEYVIHYELQHCGYIYVRIILWVHEYDLEG